MKLIERLANRIPVLDGAIGTMLLHMGMPHDMSAETFGLQNPDLVTQVHKKYVQAGAEIITTNTFQANLSKLHSQQEVEQAIFAGVKNAKASGAQYVALDVGPLGIMMEPMGVLSFEQAVEQFGMQMAAGEAAGADLILVETMSDLYEVKAAVIAAREYTNLPICCTLSFEADARTFLGVDAASVAVTLSALGVDALGANCSLGPHELLPVVKKLVAHSTVPVLVQPNAGLPRIVDEVAHYDITPEEFSTAVVQMVESGVSMVGGCCGTTPQHIELLKKSVQNYPLPKPKGELGDWITTGTRLVSYSQCQNRSGALDVTQNADMTNWLRKQDMEAIAEQAIDAASDGCDLLCINVDVPDLDSVSCMADTVRAAQSMAQVPLLLCSENPDALCAGARVARGRPAVRLLGNACSQSLLAIKEKYGAFIVE